MVRSAGAEPDGTRLAYPNTAVDSEDDARRAAQTIETKAEIAALACISDATHRPDVVAALRAAARANRDLTQADLDRINTLFARQLVSKRSAARSSTSFASSKTSARVSKYRPVMERL